MQIALLLWVNSRFGPEDTREHESTPSLSQLWQTCCMTQQNKRAVITFLNAEWEVAAA